MTHELAFIDPSVSDVEIIISGLRSGVEAIVLSAEEPALRQMSRETARRADISTIHVIAHGQPGEVSFSSGALNRETLGSHADDLAALGASLGSADIRLWTCETANGEEGTAFVNALARAACTPVAASSGLIGAASKGGSWALDSRAEYIPALAPLTTAGMESYQGVMAITSLTVTGATGGDTTLNAADVAGGIVLSYTMTQNSGGTSLGDDVLILIKDGSGNLLYWYTESDTNNATIPAGALGSYQGPITISLYQGDASDDGANSGNYTGTSPGYPTAATDNLNRFSFLDNNVGSGLGTPVTSSTVPSISSGTLTLDSVRPTVAISLSDSALAVGETATVTFTFSEAPLNFTVADVTAFPNGTLSGFTATANPLVYTVVFTPNANVTDTSNMITVGTTWSDAAGNAPLAATNSTNYTIDTTPPSSLAARTLDLATASDSGASSTDNLTNVTTPVITVSTLNLVTMTAGDVIQIIDTSNGNAVVGSYTVVAGNLTLGFWNGTTLNITLTSALANGLHNLAVRMVDAAGNTGIASTTPLGVTIDTTAPTVSSVAYGASDGALALGEAVTLIVNFSESVTVAGGVPTLTLNSGGTATYVSGSGTGALVFSYTPAAGQTTADLAVTALNLAGATIRDAAGNNAVTTGAATNPTGVLAVDTTAPTVSSVAYGAHDGALAAGETVTLIVNFSEAVTVAGGVPTLTLNSGGTATYVGGSGTGALVFSYTPAAGQTTADLAVTALNLAGSTIRDTAGNNALTAGAVTNPGGILAVDTAAAAPSVALAIDSGSSGVDLITNNGTLAVTGVETGALVEYSINGGATWTGSFTAVAGPNTVLARQTDVAGNVSAASTLTFTFDATPPAAPSVALATDSGVAGDLITNVGTLNVTGAEPGAAVQYSLNARCTRPYSRPARCSRSNSCWWRSRAGRPRDTIDRPRAPSPPLRR